MKSFEHECKGITGWLVCPPCCFVPGVGLLPAFALEIKQTQCAKYYM